MCSHNGREPGPKGLAHVSKDLLGRAQPVIPPNLYSLFTNIKAWGPQVTKDVSRACNGSDTRHTTTSTRVDQLLIYIIQPHSWYIY